jgi:hypothetical protein
MLTPGRDSEDAKTDVGYSMPPFRGGEPGSSAAKMDARLSVGFAGWRS